MMPMLAADRWMREFLVEDLLLLRRQQGANLIVGLIDDLVVLAMEVVVQLLHLGARIAHQGFDLMELVGSQLELVVESGDKVMTARNSEQVKSVS